MRAWICSALACATAGPPQRLRRVLWTDPCGMLDFFAQAETSVLSSAQLHQLPVVHDPGGDGLVRGAVALAPLLLLGLLLLEDGAHLVCVEQPGDPQELLLVLAADPHSPAPYSPPSNSTRSNEASDSRASKVISS